MLEPAKIQKLDQVVINRIAAGEVIQRPANALKELIENSLDAQSTNIQITVNEGGLKLLQITDNGTGVRKEDFEILCERFTTSKLREFDDLNKISTYGFRGEALASISHVAHLSIKSKTVNEICAYKAMYHDGKLKDKVTQIAGNQGTQITVENLFYNMSARKAALRSPGEEYQKIAEVVGNYAVHNSSVGFSLKKLGKRVEIRTQKDSNVIDNIRMIYGPEIAKELLKFELENAEFSFKASGYFTNANYSSKKMQFVLFINHRLVSSQGLKKALSQVFSIYLPKNANPFIYLSLEVNPQNVDVNVHPTKHEVLLLNEENIVDLIKNAIETKLLGSNQSRTYLIQAKLPGFNTDEDKINNTTLNKSVHPKEMIRTDSCSQKLEQFFGPIVQRQKSEEDANTIANENLDRIQRLETKLFDYSLTDKKIKSTQSNFNKEQKIVVKLKSVLDMQNAIEDENNDVLREIFAEHVFVGVVNAKQSLIQHGTKLYLCNSFRILRELFYQFIIFHFQNFDVFTFKNPLPIVELAKIALDQPESEWSPEDGDKSELALRVAEILIEKAEMLNEYFALRIANDCLVTIPVLIDKYMPAMSALPMYILRLATEVNWRNERECFKSFANETAIFYASIEEKGEWQFTTEHVLYPAIKEYFCPSNDFRENGAVLELTNLPRLYKVFERC